MSKIDDVIWGLRQTANGNGFHGNALLEAIEHPVTTGNDRDCIRRVLFGADTLPGDFEHLMDLADEIKRYEMPKNI